MKVFCKVLVVTVIAFVLPSTARASIGGNAIPKYSFGQIFAASSTVDLIPSTNGSGNVWGARCIISNTSDAVDLKFTVDGGTVRTISLDPLYFEQDEAGQLVSGWIPLDVAFSTSIRVQMQNGAVIGTINCWASWGTN
ncbi:MAG TPA: hypothetical protein VFE33_24865 [Thermoanaerobaculia bacterium]|nr:hypothetical protein [Thermoanaerobaculia bacterium]